MMLSQVPLQCDCFRPLQQASGTMKKGCPRESPALSSSSLHSSELQLARQAGCSPGLQVECGAAAGKPWAGAATDRPELQLEAVPTWSACSLPACCVHTSSQALLLAGELLLSGS